MRNGPPWLLWGATRYLTPLRLWGQTLAAGNQLPTGFPGPPPGGEGGIGRRGGGSQVSARAPLPQRGGLGPRRGSRAGAGRALGTRGERVRSRAGDGARRPPSTVPFGRIRGVRGQNSSAQFNLEALFLASLTLVRKGSISLGVGCGLEANSYSLPSPGCLGLLTSFSIAPRRDITLILLFY